MPRHFNNLTKVIPALLAGLGFCGAALTALSAGEARPLSVASTGSAGFTLLGPETTGVAFTNLLSDAKAAENQIRLNGSGVALGDVDGDGLCDIYLCRLEGANALYRNLGGWKFEEITARAGVACDNQYSTGAVFADVDGDGDLDLLVNGIGTGTRLFLNDGKGRFTEFMASGLLQKLGATSMTLADIDGDGDLDLYVANYRTATIRTTGFAVMKVDGKSVPLPEDKFRLEFTPEGRVLEHGEPHILYRNEGGGVFTPLQWTDGRFLDEDGNPLKTPPFDWGLSAMFRDMNGDGAPDLYVCNDFHSTDKIWINDGTGKFRAIPRLAIRKTSTFSMSVDFGDLNRDGLEDIFVADMLSPDPVRRLMQLAGSSPYRPAKGEFLDRPQFDRNTLQLNRGDGTYAEAAYFAGLSASDWTWSAILLDVDLDGYEDLLCSTGHMFDTQDLDAEARIQAKGPWRREEIPKKLLMFSKMAQRKIAFRNEGGLIFADNGAAWRFNQPGVTHGMALGDLDNDGDLDLVANNLNGPVGLYRNDSSSPRLAVRLKGIAPNTRGIGAVIRVEGGPVAQSQSMISGGRYLSGDEALRVFAAPVSGKTAKITVTWRSGNVSEVAGGLANHAYEIDEATAIRPPAKTIAPAELSLFEEVSDRIGHVHQDEDFNDFARQPLLPRKLSAMGPGVAWIDADGDGDEDLFIGGGRGGSLALIRNKGDGHFEKSESMDSHRPAQGVAGLAAVFAGGRTLLLMGVPDDEPSGNPAGVARLLDLNSRNTEDLAAAGIFNGEPVASADIDGDGDLDLFIGVGFLRGQWPKTAGSAVFRNEGGHFVFDEKLSKPLADAGLVRGAVFTDLDNDGQPDLVLAREWSGLRIYRNQGGALTEWDAEIGSNAGPRRKLSELAGLWNGVTAGDFDGDGRMDLVASNWGWNNPFQNAAQAARVASRLELRTPGPISEHPFSLVYGDFDGDGSIDMVEAQVMDETSKFRPIRSFMDMGEGMPSIREKFSSYAKYNAADVEEIVGKPVSGETRLVLSWLASTVFLNRGDHFEVRALPAEAQWSPAFGLSVADFDGDGHEDLALAENFFAVHPSDSRFDAGRGLLLKGDGQGQFVAMPGTRSGLLVYGEGRGMAVSDFDRDGRVDLAVAQNAAQTKLFRNRGGRPGLRVRLKGGPGNLAGIGASIRLQFASGKLGPAREIHAGSGYWSSDGAVAVLSLPEPAAKVVVRWPGGKTTTKPVPAKAVEVVVQW